MSPASIALNRFGYGFSAKDAAVDDPRAFLLRQFDAFDPAPAAVAATPAAP